MKKGFTLIELLAVIVILAIIALIATPIILGIIEDARNEAKIRSAELYLTAIEQAIMRKKMNDITFNPSTCIIEENNILNCGTGNIQIDVDANDVTYGYVMLNNGKIEKYNLEIDGESQTNVEETPASCFITQDNGDNTLSITGYTCGGENGTHKDVVIPKYINNMLVTEIGELAFYEPGEISSVYALTSVVIPNSVQKIGAYSFQYNEITGLIIPNSVTSIGENAFDSNQLTSLTLPNSITSIGYRVFYGNQLTSLTIPSSVTSIGEETFANNNLTSLEIPNSVTTIESGAFANNNLTSVVIPEGLKVIPLYAFHKNNLTDVVIPNGVENIGPFAFGSQYLTNVTIQNNPENIEFNELAFCYQQEVEICNFDINNIKWEPVE